MNIINSSVKLNWLIGRLAGWLAGWLARWLVGRLIGWLGMIGFGFIDRVLKEDIYRYSINRYDLYSVVLWSV